MSFNLQKAEESVIIRKATRLLPSPHDLGPKGRYLIRQLSSGKFSPFTVYEDPFVNTYITSAHIPIQQRSKS